MQPRKVIREVPNKGHYINIQLPEVGETTWRIPSMAKSSKILKLINSTGLGSVKNDDEMVENMQSNLDKVFACQGAMLGICWFSKTHDLNTPNSKTFKSLLDYGEEVFEELHKQIRPYAHIQTVFNTLVSQVVDSFVTAEEVEKKVDFLSQRTVSES